MLVMFIQYEKLVRHLYGVHTSYSTGDNIKSLVANDDRIFKPLTFLTHQNTVKSTVNQMGTVRQFKLWVEF